MALKFPRDVVAEVYLPGLGWIDVTALPRNRSLREVEPVSISRGRGRVNEHATPGSLLAKLNNDGGLWTPDNPMSDYAGLFGQNTPWRLSLRVARDTFDGRTVSNNWGTSSGGDAWSVTNATDYAVSAGRASQSIGASGSFTYAWLPAVVARDPWQRISWNMATLDVTGGDVEPAGLLFRGQGANDYYIVRTVITSAEVIQLKVVHHGPSVDTTLGTFTAPFVWGAAADIVVVAQMEAETIRAKIFSSLAVEPYGWDLLVHNDFLPAAGWVGVRLGVATGNTNTKPLAVTYNNYECRLIRHAGELAEIDPNTDDSHKAKTASIQSAGVLRRIGVPARPVMKSAPQRFITRNSPAAYWRLDEGEFADACKPQVGTALVRFVADETDYKKHFGKGLLGGYVPPGFSLFGEDEFGSFSFGTTVSVAATTEWTFDFIRNGGPWSRADLNVITTTGTWQLSLVMTTIGISDLFFDPGGTLVASSSDTSIFDNQAHHIRLRVSTSGANSLAQVWFDGVLAMSGTKTGVLVGSITGWNFSYFGGAAGPAPAVAAGHVAIWGTTAPNVVDSANASIGYRGERAGRRLERLCLEEGVPFDWIGAGSTLDQTAAMGPQGPVKVVDALWECADAEGGDLYELRSAAGLGLRTLRSLQAQLVRATLDYSAGHLVKPLDTRRDPQNIRNSITVDLPTGEQYTVEQTSGSLNTNDPGEDADGVGSYTDSPTLNLASAVMLPDAAHLRLALGTVQESRRPVIRVNLRSPDVAGVAPDLLGVNIGDRVLVQNLQARDVYQDLDLVVIGVDEVLKGGREHELKLKTEPYEPYRTGTYGDAESRYDSGGVTTLDAQLTAGTTGARNITTATGMRWTVTAASYPLDVVIGGERITVSGMTGTGAAQVMTISARNVNNLPAAGGKTHPAGTPVTLYQPVRYGRA
jgi:hypothetical protein